MDGPEFAELLNKIREDNRKEIREALETLTASVQRELDALRVTLREDVVFRGEWRARNEAVDARLVRVERWQEENPKLLRSDRQWSISTTIAVVALVLTLAGLAVTVLT